MPVLSALLLWILHVRLGNFRECLLQIKKKQYKKKEGSQFMLPSSVAEVHEIRTYVYSVSA